MRCFISPCCVRVLHSWFACVVIQLSVAPAWCAVDPEPDVQTSAAAEFDAGVEHFERGHYEAAVRAFLRAHELVPSRDALANALVSAEQAQSPPLAATTATRVLESTVADAPLKTAARSLLDAALPAVARLHLSCAPAPCELRLGDEVLAPGRHYLSPGSYRLSASSPQSNRQEEQSHHFEAGVEYRIAFDLPPPVEQVPSSRETTLRVPAPNETDELRDEATESLLVAKDTISYVGVAVTVALVGATTWSGLDTLRYRQTLPDRSSQAEVDKVHSKIRRTDLLLGASVASALATTAWILWGTDITTTTGGNNLDVAIHAGGATLSARGFF